MLEGTNHERSHSNRSEVCHGKPVIRGTRTPVTVILNALAGGDSFETLENEYSITTDDIRACIAFASLTGVS